VRVRKAGVGEEVGQDVPEDGFNGASPVRVRKAWTSGQYFPQSITLQWGLTREGEEGLHWSLHLLLSHATLQWGLTREGEEGARATQCSEQKLVASMGPHP